MLTSLALVFISGLIFSRLFSFCRLPGLTGMIAAGILIGPYGLNWLDSSLLSISTDLRQTALVIILTRAGLFLRLDDLKAVGRPAILLCFLPASFEICAVIFLSVLLTHLSPIEGAILGAVLSAVSPAVIVPRMLKLMDEKYGCTHKIPQMILAGASVDDIFVIVVFSICTSLASGAEISPWAFVAIPASILTGCFAGICSGIILALLFRKIHTRDSVKILIMLSASFLLLELERRLKGFIPLSGLLGIMTMAMTLLVLHTPCAARLSIRYNKLWVCAEILLFVLVGAAVDLSYVAHSGIAVILIILGALVTRMLGTYACMLKTHITGKERLFCMLSYTPKATVQAAIGSIPLSMGLSCGNLVLTAAVLSILITAPLGAFVIDTSYSYLLEK